MRLEISGFILLGLLSYAVGAIVLTFQTPPVSQWPLVIAIFVCLTASIPPIILRHRPFALKNPAAMPIATVGWRMGVLLVSLGLSAATKWPLHILFCLSVLGCYFPFLVLESALSIRRIRLETR